MRRHKIKVLSSYSSFLRKAIVGSLVSGKDTMRVFVAEACDPVRQRLIEMVGEQAGWILTGQARGVKNAVEAIIIDRPDLLILGSRLIDGCNFDVLKRLGPNYKQIKIIMLCDKVDGNYLYAARTQGVDYLLELPRDIELIHSLMRHLHLAEQRKPATAS